MLIVAIVLSLIFGSLGFVVTINNAKYLLSGYNTMSEADRAKMDIVGYLRFVKRFHIFLGISLLAGVLLLYLFNHNWASSYMVLYPLLAYTYLLAKGNTFYRGTSGQKAGTYIGLAILLVVIVAVGSGLFTNFKNNEIVVTEGELEIRGVYGFKIPKADVTNVAVVKELPAISIKTNGFAAGDYAKGSFRTKDGKKVKLFVNKEARPFLLLNTQSEEIYYSSDEVSTNDLYDKIKKWQEE
jgi:hypothetical protein